eukprot:5163596-Prymnesium_polylepis.1
MFFLQARARHAQLRPGDRPRQAATRSENREPEPRARTPSLGAARAAGRHDQRPLRTALSPRTQPPPHADSERPRPFWPLGSRLQAGTITVLCYIDGEEFVLDHQGAGTYFGEVAVLLDGRRREVSVRAASFCSMYSFSSDSLSELLLMYPE